VYSLILISTHYNVININYLYSHTNAIKKPISLHLNKNSLKKQPVNIKIKDCLFMLQLIKKNISVKI